jgi:acyl-CoA synthetase (AMP-forming)/AMP-acid ligase II
MMHVSFQNEWRLPGRAKCFSLAATAKAITPDGWFKTGDVATIDKDGWVYIKDRSASYFYWPYP